MQYRGKTKETKHLIGLILITIALCGCTNRSNNTVSSIEVSGNHVNLLHLNNIKDSITINLSDIAGDLHFIRVETNPQCLVNNPQFYIGRNCILSFERAGPILQFDINGKYIRTIASNGRGPADVTMYLWAVDEQNNTLYIRDEAKDHFISFNLTTGKYLGDIPTALPGEIIQFIVPRPGVFAVAPVLNKSVLQNRNYLYWQNTHGDLLGSIAASPDIKLFGGHRVMYQYDGSVGYKRKTDTLFTLTERDYAPDWIFQIENKPQADPADPGSKTINIISLQKNFILCNLFVAGQKQIREQSGNQGRITTSTGKLYHLFIDKVNRKASYVSRMIADKIGQPVRPELLNSQPDGTLFYAFNAMQLKDMLAKSLAEKEFGTDFKNQLQDLDVQVNAGDNPILLVGQVKR